MKAAQVLPYAALLGTSIAYPTSSSDELVSFERGVTAALHADMVKRAPEFNVNMFYATLTASGTFAYMAAGVCPRTASEENVNNAQCGIAATLSTLNGVFAAWQLGGLVYYQGPTTGRRMFKRDSLPYEDSSLVDGYLTTINYHGTTPESDGVDWHHYSISNYHVASGNTYNSTAKFHPNEDRQHVSSPVVPDGDDLLGKRQSFPNAIYAWRNEQETYFDNSNHGDGDVQRLAEDVWNHAHDNNLGEFCASFQTDGSNPIKWNSGYYALKSGTWTDRSGEC